ncbi:MAG: hypothetical protein JWN98_870 [Abditibacteriota bacterium]|nr:hypothetical protein [Abditibacteriota bacterium]
MPFARAGQLARLTPSVRADDLIGLVAENLRESPYGAIPVLDRVLVDDPNWAPPDAQSRRVRVLGLIDERDLSRAVLPMLEHAEASRQSVFSSEAIHEAALAAQSTLGLPSADFLSSSAPSTSPRDWMRSPFPRATQDGSQNGHVSPVRESSDIERLTAREIMRPDVGIVPASFSLHNALLTLERYDAAALPVVDHEDHFLGMISRADVVAALGQQVRPPVVGGMATPLGVWLTTGSISAGARPFGLFLSGLSLGACFVVTEVLLQFGLSALNEEWGRLFASGRLGIDADGTGLLNFGVILMHSLIFLLLLRSLPMSGIHAAEHQTVWAIEKGLALTPENVAQMPRAHPRCGTNLMALSGLILIVFKHLPDFSPFMILLALLFIYLSWRRFGTAMQELLTTKPASPKQLESGIRAGRELLRKYQEQPHVQLSFAMRLFNSGLIFSMIGLMLVLQLYSMVEAWLRQIAL